jgi:drug/metabolite transporter superfamily protein YnfA
MIADLIVMFYLIVASILMAGAFYPWLGRVREAELITDAAHGLIALLIFTVLLAIPVYIFGQMYHRGEF